MEVAPTLPDLTSSVRLDGRGIVVLGAGGQGLGTATARLLAAGGATVLCVDNREDQAREVASQVGGVPWVADITDRAQVEALFAHVDTLFGERFHGVVDIVGADAHGRLEDFDDATIDRLLAFNLRHAIHAIQIAGPMLARRGRGAMAFISSPASDMVSPGHAIYGVAKAGLNHLIRYAAEEYGPSGVRTNGVSPGLIITPKMRAAPLSSAIQQIVADIPLRRIGQPTDIAGAVYFLMSELAAFVNGSILNVDGGYMVGSHGVPRMGRTAITPRPA